MRDLNKFSWSAPQKVCARTRSRFRALVHLSFKCFMCGMKDSLQSKTTPKNLVSSTTGTGVLFSSRMASGWGLRNLQKCMHRRERTWIHWCLSAQSASLLRYCCRWCSIIWTCWDLYQIRKSSTYKEHSTPGDIALTIELIFNPNRVTERILPWGTPISWSKRSE